MMPLDEDVRTRLHAALSDLPVPAADFEPVGRAGALRRRRTLVATTAAVALVTAGVVAGGVALVGSFRSGAPDGSLGVAHHGSTSPQPSAARAAVRAEQRAALTRTTQGANGHLRLGPLTDAAGTWGFFQVARNPYDPKATLHVLRWAGGTWQPAAVLHFDKSTYGPLLTLRAGPTIAGDGVSAFGTVAGGDNVPGALAVRINGVWQWASFAGCGLPADECGTVRYPTQVQNEAVKHGVLVSYPDDNIPSHAAGTSFTDTWRWNPQTDHFELVTSEVSSPGQGLQEPTGAPVSSPASPVSTAPSASCSDLARTQTFVQVTRVLAWPNGTATVGTRGLRLHCGGPNDQSYRPTGRRVTYVVARNADLEVLGYGANGRALHPVTPAELAASIDTDSTARYFRVETSPSRVTRLSEVYHP